MTSNEATKAVTEDDDRHDFTCPRCGFTSTGHESKTAAAKRGQEHLDEHDNTEGN